MRIDITKTGQQNLLDLINGSNSATSLAIAANQVTFGAVSDFSGGTKPGLNTQVTVTAVLDGGFSGERVVKYQRLDVAQASNYQGAEILIEPEDSREIVLQKIATALGLRISDVELDGELEYPANENSPTTIGVKGVDGSFLYLPSVIDIALTVPDVDVPLIDAILVDELDGFDPVTE